MNNLNKSFVSFVVVAIFSFYTFSNFNNNVTLSSRVKYKSTSSPKVALDKKKARQEYFYNMLRDPKTKRIPENIREKELEFAKKLNELNKSLSKTSSTNELDWKEIGPGNVGGRTRAIAVDINDPNTIIAGGASGGIWKSTDKGNTWAMKSTNSQILSVTTLAQDPRPGQTNTWYYGAGEINGSAGDPQKTHRLSGDGLYKSTDNGESWNVLTSTFSSNFASWDNAFDFVEKIEINPMTGTVYAAVYGIGIFKSTDGGENFTLAFGGTGNHEYSDVSIGKDGTIAAVVSSPYGTYTSPNPPGVYISSDDGNNWTSSTPGDFPQTVSRSLIEIAPSNNNIAYVVSYVKFDPNTGSEEISFFKLNLSNSFAENRSSNLPSFDFTATNSKEVINTQGGYNLVLAVKPDDENFVLIGSTSLFRSTNGFATKPNNAKLDWIGGYHPTYFGYPNFHPDIHSYYFEPNNPNAVWWGHDGGLSYTADISQTNYQDVFQWENKNNGYNVTQFYHVSISQNPSDNRIMGGTQDNGTPFWIDNGIVSNQIADVSSGDGYYSYFGSNYAYTSVYNGIVMRLGYSNENYPSNQVSFSRIYPKSASNQLFLNSFAIDPTNENIMYYPSGNSLWRNNQLSSIPEFEDGTTVGWSNLENLALPTGYVMLTVAVSNSNPAHRLYYGGIDFSQQTKGDHKLFRLDNANTSTDGAIDITIPDVAPFSFINNISVNPLNADEIVVVFSNYNIAGVYYSNDGGITFSEIEGNLKGDETFPGPSIRSAEILPTANGLQYFLATSTGVYSTFTLDGTNTNWVQEGINSLGNVVVNSLASRKSDAKIVAGTHGRGAFAAFGEAIPNIAIADVNVDNLTLQSRPGENGTTSFQLSNNGAVDLTYNISATGNFGGNLEKKNDTKLELKPPDKNSEAFKNYMKNSKFMKSKRNLISNNQFSQNSISGINGEDYLILDDGDATADDFIGPGNGLDFDWYNEFFVNGFNIELETLEFFVRTENAFANNIYAAIYDKKDSLLQFGYFVLDLSKEGQWYNAEFNPKITFNDGDNFKVEIYSYSLINFPAGTDTDAQIPNQSYYFDISAAKWININTLSGFENAAFLIRTKGTKSAGGGNQNPIAVATVSKTQVLLNESITFDGSTSSDTDGQLTQYLWDFGDGSTSNQAIATHSYSQEGTFNYSLTVTDNQGGTGKASGEIIVGSNNGNLVLINPSSGTILPGGSQSITLTLNAQNLGEGTYTGQLNISSNGGNITIPINYLVDVEQISSLPAEFSLSQNYPNPFNPSTFIEFSLPMSSNVSLKIYDILGKEVANLLHENKSAGSYKVEFDASDISSGIYIYKIEADGFSRSRKMLFLK